MKTIDEIRHENLLIAISRAGSIRKLEEKAEIGQGYLSQIKGRHQNTKSGKPRAVGDEAARKIELAIGEGIGWMDTDHGLDDGPPENEDERQLMHFFRKMAEDDKGTIIALANRLYAATKDGPSSADPFKKKKK